jgi:hypothetical protein
VSEYILQDKILVPPSCVKQAQMSKPVVFWHNKKRDHIMNAPGPDIKPPFGYQKIECVHAHEVDKWSSRLRAQEKRIREMSDEEFYLYEDAIRAEQIAELKKNLENSPDLVNRLFMKAAIEHAEKQREKARPVYIQRETYQACEAEEGVAS